MTVSTSARPRPGDVRSLYDSRFGLHYDMRATWWERTLSRRSSRQFHDCLRSLPSRPLRVLDLGCGTGRNLGRLYAAGVVIDSYRGVDSSATMLDAANRNHPYSRADFELVEDLGGLVDERYDLVLCTWVLSHLTDPRRTIEEALGVLTDDGNLIVAALTSTPHPIGALLANNYRRRLHASPVEPGVLTAAQPRDIHHGLFGLTSVAHYRRDSRSLVPQPATFGWV